MYELSDGVSQIALLACAAPMIVQVVLVIGVYLVRMMDFFDGYGQ
jgi:hypothetical protein